VDDTLKNALAFDRGVRMRGAQRTIEIPEGVVVRHDDLPMLYHLNALLLATAHDPKELERLADHHLAGVPHRHVVIDDAPAAEALAPALLAAGWTRQRFLFMHSPREPDHPPRAGVAREIDDGQAHPLHLAIVREDAPRRHDDAVADALAERLVAGQEAVRAGTRSRCFAAGEGDGLQSMGTLFIADGTAMIEEVGTLREYRGRGLARAVVSAALAAAHAEGCGEIIVPADADDWPQLLYAKLGFEPLGRQVAFTKH
jgi:GNAT superfamily N-acetyltransferase